MYIYVSLQLLNCLWTPVCLCVCHFYLLSISCFLSSAPLLGVVLIFARSAEYYRSSRFQARLSLGRMSDRLQSHGVTSRMRAKALRKQTKPLLASLLGARLDALYENAMVHCNASRFLPSFMQGLRVDGRSMLGYVMISVRGTKTRVVSCNPGGYRV
ncbi:hypothetical protein J3E68DRAFT_394068 [Trichoderma sp. SZMC 28012]